jgi:hypothetical protein
MAAKPSIKTLLTRVGRLRQTDEIWEFASHLAWVWITPRRQPPYRPYLLIVVNQEGKAILSDTQQFSPDPEQMLAILLQAMTRPGFKAGKPRRPQTVHLNNADLVSALGPTLAEFDIGCEYRAELPSLNRTRRFLEKGFSKGEPYPGLLSIPDVTPPLVQHLYELAAEFYQAAPWRWLGDHDPLVVSYPPKAKPRYAIVMGSGGEIFGLAVYDTVEDLRLIFRRNLSQLEVIQRSSWLVLFFDEPIAMSFADLDAIAHYDWPVVNERAYPVFGRTAPNGLIDLPTKADIVWLEGVLSGFLGYLPQLLESGFDDEDPEDLILPVQTISGKAKMRLQMPELEELL